MRIARFRRGDLVAYGMVEGTELVELEDDPFASRRLTERRHPLRDIKLLVPTTPTAVLAAGRNYQDHLQFAAAAAPEGPRANVPSVFNKGVSCLTATEEPIIIPAASEGEVHYEGELVVVIGKRARRVKPEEALDYVLGYACGNDVSERAWQKGDGQFWRAKGADTFGPVGPWIATDLDPFNLDLELRVNGEVRQKANTREMIHNVPAIVSFLSQAITLHPGDLVFTGTPGVPTALQPGDVVEVEISGIGVLRNPVRREE